MLKEYSTTFTQEVLKCIYSEGIELYLLISLNKENGDDCQKFETEA